jgi:hypothetical protein
MAARPYRTDEAALAARKAELERELADATGKADALRDAQREKARVQKELVELEAKIARSAPRKLPLLERVQIASPSNVSWDDMTGDERVRFCGKCAKDVYNVSAMPRAEAEALLVERAGSLCVRIYKRVDGTVLTADCPVGVRKKRVRRALFVAAGASALAAATSTLFVTQGEPGPVMGKVASPVRAPEATPTATPSAPEAITGSAAVPADPPPAAKKPARR